RKFAQLAFQTSRLRLILCVFVTTGLSYAQQFSIIGSSCGFREHRIFLWFSSEHRIILWVFSSEQRIILWVFSSEHRIILCTEIFSNHLAVFFNGCFLVSTGLSYGCFLVSTGLSYGCFLVSTGLSYAQKFQEITLLCFSRLT